MGFFDQLKQGLSKTRESLTAKIETTILGYADIDDGLLDELEEILIMADVGVATTETLMKAVRQGDKRTGRFKAVFGKRNYGASS